MENLGLHKTRRWGRVIMYAGLAISGALSIIFPSRLVSDQVGNGWVFAWSGCMLLAGIGCMCGAVTDRWIFEYSAIPMLSCVLALYGLSAIISSVSTSPVLFAYGLIVLSLASGLVARWRDIQALKRASQHKARG